LRILTVSDRVEPVLSDRDAPSRFPGVDLILSCGDLPPEYLSFLRGLFGVPLYYVLGNHDIRHDSKPPKGCTNLNERLVSFRGMNFLGLEGSRWYNGGLHQFTERQMKWTITKLRPALWRRGGVDLVVTHAPPRHVQDAEDHCHRGFRSFRWLIDKYTPKYFIHGHIHASFTEPTERVTIVNQTKVINSYGYFIFDIEPGSMAQ
jgi:Icc-related predicted phosphoesterase